MFSELPVWANAGALGVSEAGSRTGCSVDHVDSEGFPRWDGEPAEVEYGFRRVVLCDGGIRCRVSGDPFLRRHLCGHRFRVGL